MFTGLIETTGTLLAITPTAGATRITIASPPLPSRLTTGDSIAVNGVCLTALSIEPNAFPPRFSADLAAENIARTTITELRHDAVVNLELPTPAGSPLGRRAHRPHPSYSPASRCRRQPRASHARRIAAWRPRRPGPRRRHRNPALS